MTACIYIYILFHIFHPIELLARLLGPGKQKTVVPIQVILRLSVEHGYGTCKMLSGRVGIWSNRVEKVPAQAIVKIAQLVRRRAWGGVCSEFYPVFYSFVICDGFFGLFMVVQTCSNMFRRKISMNMYHKLHRLQAQHDSETEA